jgi:hypothetical protein
MQGKFQDLILLIFSVDCHYTDVFCILICYTFLHEMNAYRTDPVCLSIHPPRWLKLRTTGWICVMCMELHYWGLHQSHTFRFPTVSNFNMADERTSDVGSTVVPLG